MESWTQSIVSSLVTVIITLAGVIGYLKANSKNNPNGTKDLDKEFSNQVQRCNERFIEIAKANGGVNTSLKNIERRLENIEGWLKK